MTKRRATSIDDDLESPELARQWIADVSAGKCRLSPPIPIEQLNAKPITLQLDIARKWFESIARVGSRSDIAWAWDLWRANPPERKNDLYDLYQGLQRTCWQREFAAYASIEKEEAIAAAQRAQARRLELERQAIAREREALDKREAALKLAEARP